MVDQQLDDEDITSLPTEGNEIESDGIELFNDPLYPLQWYLVNNKLNHKYKFINKINLM